jgi:lipopolysaccharide export system protein LptA
MPISIPRLRIWFAMLAIAVVAVVAGFYFYARIQNLSFLKQLPAKLGVDIQQSSQGFSLSKSQGGRTLFTIRAANAVQYKDGGRAELRDVNIVVYGRQSNRFDQIYGSTFEYDPKAGTVIARGEVNIDLEGNASGPAQADQASPRELQNPIHLKTSGLVFTQQTGIAHTDQYVEFRVPQGDGSAVGVTYDTKNNVLTLDSEVALKAKDQQHTTVHAAHGTINKEPREIDLSDARIHQQDRDFQSDRLELLLTSENEVQRVVATGNVQLLANGPNPTRLRSPHAEMMLGVKNQLQTAVFSGGVVMETSGSDAATITAGRVAIKFAEQNRPQVVHASESVRVQQQSSQDGKQQQRIEITSQTADMYVRQGRLIAYAQSEGPAQVTITPAKPAVPGEHTVVTAARMRAEFDGENHLDLVRGEPQAKVTSIVPGQPDKVSTSDSVVAHFARGGGVLDVRQEGNFRYSEHSEPDSKNSAMGPGGRFAYAARARYTPDEDVLTLAGSPRIVDGGMTVTANIVRIVRRTGDAFAQGSVKTTYSEVQQNPDGAILATRDPVHVTSSSMNVQRQSGIARYLGNARLWQGANVVEAPSIEFDRPNRSLVAQGSTSTPVTSVFVQIGKNGKTTPVVVTAARLVYSDSDRRARYTGGVLARGEAMTMTSASADVILVPAKSRSAESSMSPSQLDQIVALGNIVVQQQDRRATGEKLVYTAADEKFVMTGGSPLLADSAHGTIRGDSLTFYSRDDRVLVESSESSRTITRTRVTR